MTVKFGDYTHKFTMEPGAFPKTHGAKLTVDFWPLVTALRRVALTEDETSKAVEMRLEFPDRPPDQASDRASNQVGALATPLSNMPAAGQKSDPSERPSYHSSGAGIGCFYSFREKRPQRLRRTASMPT